MSRLIENIGVISLDAVKVLTDADFHRDCDIQSLTRIDLNELFPGSDKLKLRRQIFEIIQKQPNDDNKDMNEYIPHESAALINDGVLDRYLHMLKDIRTQVLNLQTSLDRHIYLVENQLGLKTNRGSSATTAPIEAGCSEKSGNFQATKVVGWVKDFWSKSSGGRTAQTNDTVICKVVVSGKTFNAHLQLLEKVKLMGQNSNFVFIVPEMSPNNQDYQIIIVFCPVSSRVGTDVEAAMHEVKDSKPIILVLMHHVHEAKNTYSMKTWSDDHNVVLQVDVFYHETARGLLDCQQNYDAATSIKSTLLGYKIIES